MFNFSRRPTMVKFILLVLFVGSVLSQHRIRKQTGFLQMVENLEQKKHMKENKNIFTNDSVGLTCLPLCGMSATFHNIFTQKYIEQAFSYELNKATENMTKFMEREKEKKKQKNIRKIDMKNLNSKSANSRRGFDSRFIRFS
jgi:hypothetical protein